MIQKHESSYDPLAHGARCHECPCYGSTVVPPTIVEDDELFIYGENPGEQEVKKLEGFVGPSGALLKSILQDLGVNPKKVSKSNAWLCRCTVPGEKSPGKKHDSKLFMQWLRRENARLAKEAKANKRYHKPIPTPMECCWPRLKAELEAAEARAKARGLVNGAVVVPVGGYAVAALLRGKNAGIMKLRGSVTILEKVE